MCLGYNTFQAVIQTSHSMPASCHKPHFSFHQAPARPTYYRPESECYKNCMVIPQSQEDLHRPPGNSPVPRKSSMVAGSLATACVARKEQCSPRGPTDPLRPSPTNGERWEPTCLLMLISCCDSRGGLQKGT